MFHNALEAEFRAESIPCAALHHSLILAGVYKTLKHGIINTINWLLYRLSGTYSLLNNRLPKANLQYYYRMVVLGACMYV